MEASNPRGEEEEWSNTLSLRFFQICQMVMRKAEIRMLLRQKVGMLLLTQEKNDWRMDSE